MKSSILKMMLKLNRLAKIFNLNEYLINLLNLIFLNLNIKCIKFDKIFFL